MIIHWREFVLSLFYYLLILYLLIILLYLLSICPMDNISTTQSYSLLLTSDDTWHIYLSTGHRRKWSSLYLSAPHANLIKNVIGDGVYTERTMKLYALASRYFAQSKPISLRSVYRSCALSRRLFFFHRKIFGSSLINCAIFSPLDGQTPEAQFRARRGEAFPLYVKWKHR